jgi:hypothetical protein
MATKKTVPAKPETWGLTQVVGFSAAGPSAKAVAKQLAKQVSDCAVVSMAVWYSSVDDDFQGVVFCE